MGITLVSSHYHTRGVKCLILMEWCHVTGKHGERATDSCKSESRSTCHLCGNRVRRPVTCIVCLGQLFGWKNLCEKAVGMPESGTQGCTTGCVYRKHLSTYINSTTGHNTLSPLHRNVMYIIIWIGQSVGKLQCQLWNTDQPAFSLLFHIFIYSLLFSCAQITVTIQ